MSKREKKEKSKKPSGFWARFIAKRESVVVISGITLAFIALFVLFGLLYVSYVDAEKLSLEMNVERAFNNIIWELESGSYQFDQVVDDTQIISLGVYSSSGALQYSWGKVYNRIAVSSLIQNVIASGEDSAISYNPNTGVMEYTRFLRRNVVVGTSNILSLNPAVGINNSGIQLPSILYLAFDGSEYIRNIKWIKFSSLLLLGFFAAFYVFILRLYLDNKGYRDKMSKNEALINIGSAARTLTHEIKNPLSAITLQLALMKRTLKGDDLEDLMVIDHETKRLVALTNRVSDFLKNPTGNPEPVDIVILLESLFSLFSYPINFIDNGKQQAIVMFDPERARSVFENIIKNAMESCTGRDPEVEIELTLDKKNIFHFFIRDRGDGITNTDPKKLFDPFYTTKIHGSGIGLAISRQFLNAQKGDIKIYNRDGGGTVVEITLPRYSLLSELGISSHRSML